MYHLHRVYDSLQRVHRQNKLLQTQISKELMDFTFNLSLFPITLNLIFSRYSYLIRRFIYLFILNSMNYIFQPVHSRDLLSDISFFYSVFRVPVDVIHTINKNQDVYSKTCIL